MAWKCPDCGTTGTVQDVDIGGKCWRCQTKVVWSGGPVSNLVFVDRIDKIEQFNRRALTALEHCGSLNAWDQGFLASIKSKVEHYATLSDSEQRNLLRAVMRHERSITDKAVTDYAINHAPKVTA